MKLFTTVAALVAVASAFPVLDNLSPEAHLKAAQLATRTLKKLETEQVTRPRRRQALPLPSDALGISKAQTNCGPLPCLTFDPEDQLVSVTGEYAYASPAADEIRGPCPGLNAAANHGYLPRSGIATLEETVGGLNACKRNHPRPYLAQLIQAHHL